MVTINKSILIFSFHIHLHIARIQWWQYQEGNMSRAPFFMGLLGLASCVGYWVVWIFICTYLAQGQSTVHIFIIHFLLDVLQRWSIYPRWQAEMALGVHLNHRRFRCPPHLCIYVWVNFCTAWSLCMAGRTLAISWKLDFRHITSFINTFFVPSKVLLSHFKSLAMWSK